MDDKPTIEDLQAALLANEPTSVQQPEETTVETEVTSEEDPLKVELERVRSKKTPQEKALDSLYFNAQQAKKLGIDITKDEKLKEVLGIKEQVEVSEDEKPVTRKELEEILSKAQQVNATKTAEQLAMSISNEAERELTLFHIQNTIKSTGNPEEDLKLARALTNSVRNNQILEEYDRKPVAKTHSSASSDGTIDSKPTIVLTPEEKAFLATGRVTQEEILLARQGKL